ncbi:MAG: hypothetical protein EBS84_19365 [Proteobacteria bacterium]|nr:hypothetical protein [Verrucomicrobiota bacterium]NBU11146.1 hypothetical protein [Pseudomonadota bacterium]
MNAVLTFDVNGIGHCLHTDAIPLQSLGTLEVHRATTIEFNASTQQWEVKDAEGLTLHSNPSRSCCLAWEIERFNQ